MQETARLRDEIERLRESEKMYRLAAEISRRQVWSADAAGNLTAASRRLAQMAGLDHRSDTTERLWDAVHPEDRDRLAERWARAVADGAEFEAEFRALLPDGSDRLMLARAIPVKGEDGMIHRWYGSTEDVHLERQAEHARREVEERYRLAVQATNDAVWDYDIANDVIQWSDNSADIFGSRPSPSGRTGLAWWRERIHSEDRDRVSASFAAALDDGDSHWTCAYRFVRDDGSHGDILDRGFIIRAPAGQPIRAVGAMTDLTERNRADAEIRRMQADLIHVSRLSAMGAMASTLAHELNQPLAAVSNYISGARRLAARGAEGAADLIAALESAASGAQRAGEIVRRLRELVSRGKVAMVTEHLPRLIQEASVVAFVDEEPLGIRHRIQIDPAAEWVRADRIQVEQVLINLIRNAIEAMAQSEPREIMISVRPAGAMVEVAVADTGTGIAAEHFDTLFSQFMTTKSGGMGIGLPISRTIVELHGGKIWAENRSEGGACFRFTLQAASPARHLPL